MWHVTQWKAASSFLDDIPRVPLKNNGENVFFCVQKSEEYQKWLLYLHQSFAISKPKPSFKEENIALKKR